jgi:hypothetical protein
MIGTNFSQRLLRSFAGGPVRFRPLGSRAGYAYNLLQSRALGIP